MTGNGISVNEDGLRMGKTELTNWKKQEQNKDEFAFVKSESRT